MNLAKVAKANALGQPKTQFVQEVDAPKTQGIAANAFKGPSMKGEVQKQTSNLHSKMAQNIASMHTALHEVVKTQEEDARYVQNKAANEAKAKAEEAKAKAEAEAQMKKQQSLHYQAAVKASAEKAKAEAEAQMKKTAISSLSGCCEG